MNRLILIGNGFDIMHGLETRYVNYLKYWFNDYFLHLYEDGKTENPLINTRFKHIDAARTFHRYHEQIKHEIENNLHGVLTRLAANGIEIEPTKVAMFDLSPLLKAIINKNENKWADIEHSYYQLLSKAIENGGINSLNKEIEYFQNGLLKYLKGLDIESEKINCNLVNLFLQPTEIFLNNSDKQRYLDQGINYESVDNIMILSFNYTHLINKYWEHLKQIKYKSNPLLIKIHGDMNKPDKNPIIFGYGDEKDEDYKKIENANNPDALEYIKSMKYFLSDNYKTMIEFVESDPFEVFIIGHSCGLSDKTLLSYLFEHDKCKNIYPFYHQDVKYYFEKVKEISRHFDNKVELRSKVVNLNDQNKNLLKLPNIKKQNS